MEQILLDIFGEPFPNIDYSFMAKHIHENEFDLYDKPIMKNIDLLKQSVLDKIDEE